ncbi:hypothetical protein KL931_004844 [Ogataea haglerorum]|nr:hypothetical protein KL931_004844 [Ogataea haglerorum]KAG7784255.1 hypothetical protein KL945_004616 [Ogataea haglerorum]KAG7784841.1 hypothetical protein KL910_005094 [Ogataea haglerorum]
MSSNTSTEHGHSAMRFAQFKLVLLGMLKKTDFANVLGESAVGKSSIVHRFVKDSFTDSRESTIGAAFLTQTIQIDTNTTVKFEIWDTAGQERYRSLASMYYRNAQAALVVFDITQELSLDKAKYWIKELQKQANSDIVIALVGNKLDLEEERKISKDEAQAFANELGLMYAEVSAKTGENVKDCFRDIALKLPLEEKLSQQGQRRRRTVDLNQRPSTNEQQCACKFNDTFTLLTSRLDDLMIEETPLMQKVISRLPADESYARNYRIITAHQLVLSAKILPPSKVLKPEEDIPYMLPYILEAEAEEFEKEELNHIAKA